MKSKENLKNKKIRKWGRNRLKERFLILHNDDIHSFDYVIKALVDVCEHDFIQATQCTVLTHYRGKCDVKKGNFEVLKPMKDALRERKLTATID